MNRMTHNSSLRFKIVKQNNHSLIKFWFISQVRTKKTETGFRTINKPSMVSEYNSFMGGVDLYDQRKATYQFSHRNRKWYRVLFQNLLQICMNNSRHLYDIDGNRKLSAQQFRESLVTQLLERETPERVLKPGR